MVTLHVVREDLQARGAVDEGLARQQKVFVRLSRDRLLCILADVNVPVEHAPRLAAEDATIELDARARGRDVVDAGVVVRLLRPPGHVQTVQREASAGGPEEGVLVVPRRTPAEGAPV